MRLLSLLIIVLLSLLATPAFATPSEDVTVGLDRLEAESDVAYYDRLFVQCGSWLPPYEDVKDAAKAKLIELSASTLTTLIPTWYASTNVRHRVTMEEIIKGIGPPAVPFLTPYLNDPEPIMRQRIVTSLGDLDDPAVLPALREQLRQEIDVQVLPALIDALGKRGIHNTLLVEELTPHLTYPDERVRRSAAVALGRIDDLRGVLALIPLLDDPLFSVRAPVTEAIWSLTKDRWAAMPLPEDDEGGWVGSLQYFDSDASWALWMELDSALRILDSKSNLHAEAQLRLDLFEISYPPNFRRGILRGIQRAWSQDHVVAAWALPLLETAQKDLATEAVRLEVKAAIAAQIEREAIAAAKANEAAP